MTLWEMLSQARDAALEIRRIEMETDERIGSIGVGARSYEAHGALGSVLDPMRKVDELIDWQSGQIDSAGLVGQIEDASEIVSGIRASGDGMAAEIALRYFVRAEPMTKIAADVKGRSDATAEMDDAAAAALMLRALEKSLCYWDEIGIARLREIGNQNRKSEIKIGNQNKKSEIKIRREAEMGDYEGKYVRLTEAIDGAEGIEVGDVFYKDRTGVDLTQPHGWEFDVWVRVEDGRRFKLPKDARSHFEVVEDMG